MFRQNSRAYGIGFVLGYVVGSFFGLKLVMEKLKKTFPTAVQK